MIEQEPVPPQPASEESLNAEIPVPEGVETDPAAEQEEEEIDLNPLFPEEETDLNELFPEPELRSLLKKVQRNKKDLGKMKDRFSESFDDGDSD
ncbi:MAG: hypothetical protein E2O43_05280 [Nitrospina sp.]|nr:MAG: hypothetical protein E2O43_05280 [Nitrospina sp.]